MHQEKTRIPAKSAKISHFGQNDEDLTKFRWYEQCQNKPCAYDGD